MMLFGARGLANSGIVYFLSPDGHDYQNDYPGFDFHDNRLEELRDKRYHVYKIFLTEEDTRNPNMFMYGTDQDFSMTRFCLCIIPACSAFDH